MTQQRIVHRLITALAFAAGVPGSLMAQANSGSQALLETPASTVAAPANIGTADFGPYATQAGVTRALPAAAPTLHLQQGNVGGRNVALMLIGGATLVVGSVIGGDAGTIIMITGGVIGLTGLWRYLQ